MTKRFTRSIAYSVSAFLNTCLLSFVLMFLLVGSNILVSHWLT